MKSKKAKLILGAAFAAAVILGVTAYASTSYGSREDPLITKSYIDDTLTPQLMASFEEKLESAGVTEAGAFEVVTLSNGQTLVCEAGCELMLRVGTATVYASDTPGLVDTTGGTTLSSGSALTTNHLYMATIDGHGVTATAQTVKLLVNGAYNLS